MNVARLRWVANRIELEGRFDYLTFVSGDKGDTPRDDCGSVILDADLKRLNDCGTSGCIAGWAGLVALEMGEIPQENDTWMDFAERWLGLTEHQAERLFFAWVVPDWHSSSDPDRCWGMNAIEVAKLLREIADGEIDLPDTDPYL